MKYFVVDWAMKRGIYINMLLRAYSREVFIPTQIFEKCQSKGEFVEQVSAIFKEFITNNIACDDDAIKREVCTHPIKPKFNYLILG